MKILYSFSFILALFIAIQCGAETYKTYGAEPALSSKPLTVSEAVKQKNSAQALRIRGKVTAVCQRKGCWMLLTDGQNTARTTFKDYSFFVPTDISGKEVIVEGTLSETVISEKEARHYALDSGKTAAEIESIQGEQKGYAIQAVSVQIPN